MSRTGTALPPRCRSLPRLAHPALALLVIAAPALARYAGHVSSSPDLGKAEGRCRASEEGPAILADIKGLKDRRGLIKLEVYPANDDDFLADDNALVNAGKVFRRVEQPVNSAGPVTLCVRIPGPGSYSIVVLHDRDANHKFGWWGDGVGFAGNPRLGWSKPSAEAARIMAGGGITRTTIVMNYRHGLGRPRFAIPVAICGEGGNPAMKIVDVCAFFTPHGGGVKTYIEQKLAIGPQLGHDITILAPGDRHAVIEKSSNARIITIPNPRFPLDRKYWYFDDETALHGKLDELAPDFLEVSSPWRSPSMVTRWPGAAPRALVMHADPLSAYAYRWLEPILPRQTIDRRFEPFWKHLRLMGQSFDRVVCASGELQSRLALGGVANTSLHPMGIEAGLFSPARRSPALRRQLLELCDLPETAQLLIGIGRLSAEKRWPMVVDAVTAASQAMPIGLVILGAGNQKKRIERQIAGNPHIRLLAPERDRVRFATLVASADAMIHGCEAETFCMAAAEARASGIPVIVPDRGGAADHARGGAGITYPAGSALAAADATIRLLRDPPRGPFPGVVTMHEHFERLFADYAAVARRATRRVA